MNAKYKPAAKKAANAKSLLSRLVSPNPKK